MPKPGTATTRARRLRRDQTDVERRLWNLVRNRSVGGLKFTRHYPIGPFIADYDRRRTAFLNASGYSVLRFWNNEVLYQLAGVHDLITAAVEGKELGPSPGWRFSPATLSPKGRGDPTAIAAFIASPPAGEGKME